EGGHSGSNATISAPVDFGSVPRYVTVQSNNNDYSHFLGDLIISGAISGTTSSALVFNGLPQSNDATLALSGSNASFLGSVNILRGNLALASTTALSAANSVTMSPASGQNAALYLFGRNVTIGSLIDAGAGV